MHRRRLDRHWARNKDDAGDKIIANDYTKGPTRFTARKGEFVSITELHLHQNMTIRVFVPWTNQNGGNSMTYPPYQPKRSTGWLVVSDTLMNLVKKIKSVPKDSDAREVPLTARALEILTKWETEIPARDGCGLPHTNGRKCPSDLVLRQTNGSPLSITSFRDVLGRALRKAKLAPGSPYDLRHCFASRLAEASVDGFEIARLMGHSDVKTSMVYVHRTASARSRILAALGDPTATELRLVEGVGRGIDRGTTDVSSTLPDTPSESPSQAS